MSVYLFVDLHGCLFVCLSGKDGNRALLFMRF